MGLGLVDAFSKHDWNLDHCCTCQKLHRELSLVMPPLALVGPAVKRCREDSARAMFVVPRSIIAPWCPALMRAIHVPLVEIGSSRHYLEGWGTWIRLTWSVGKAHHGSRGTHPGL